MPPLRSDAARSRERILAAAAGRDRGALRLNDVARDAGVGVGTVYRHFPTVEALVEELTAGTVRRALDTARAALADDDPAAAFQAFLSGMLDLLLADEGLQQVLLAADDSSPEVRDAKAELTRTAATLLDRAQRAGAVRADLTLEQLMHLVCGFEHAVRLGSPEDRGTVAAVFRAGLRPE
ncbi:TetR family transcriptional regulator [Cellulomonas sp. IC4_254]|uniref:TetR/AcrR family transcriptional regulator n=1 Tax=Cellulomonas sp. IC4_254 TaxID=2714040 RepID=UPI001422C4B5|nr:TetR family transcriptional regulator [Cellulomonas sp. IC4_254]NHT19467.1 helix-turn-helix transcriptional regulator [Cellulomonas sp. IC4_254]